MQGLEDDVVNLCEPIILKVTAKEVITKNENIDNKVVSQLDVSDVDIAIIIDDIINREPRFLQNM